MVAAVLNRIREVIATDSFRRRAWLAVIVAVLGFYKITLTASTGWTNIDGGYYTDVAAHVRDGRGLVSSCSILHEAYPRFPHPTAVYPLWPLLLGWIARVFPIFEAGKWLATACYFATLGFAYLWGRALHDEPLLPPLGLNAGHVLVLMFGLHDYFFQFTSFPYTEGLSYALACAALWRMTRLLPRPTWLGGLEIGVWLGLLILARYQMVLMAMAAFPVLAGAALVSTGPRRRYALMTLAMAAGLLLSVGPHYLYVRGFTPNLGPGLYVQWQRVRFMDVLAPIPDVLEVKGALPWILDRLKGFLIAFDPRDHNFGYVTRFYTFQYALVAAAPLLLWRGARNASREKVLAAWAWARRPENLNWVYVVVLAAGCFVMIHSMHMNPILYPQWYFSQRHALVCMFAFFLALVFLLAQASLPWRLLGALVLCSGTVMGVHTIRAQAIASEGRRAPGSPKLIQWLNEESDRRGGMVVALRQPQSIAYKTRGVGYHWYYSRTSFNDVRAMVTDLGAAYVIVPGGQSYSFTKSTEFDDAFQLVQTIEGFRIYEPDQRLVHPPAAP